MPRCVIENPRLLEQLWLSVRRRGQTAHQHWTERDWNRARDYFFAGAEAAVLTVPALLRANNARAAELAAEFAFDGVVTELKEWRDSVRPGGN
jgi:hypothetical protein